MSKFIFILLGLFVSIDGSAQRSNLENDLQRIFTKYVDSGFSGVVLIMRNDTVLLQKAYGYANDEKKIANTPKTLFNVASIGKQFTAAIVLKLEEQGLLNTKEYVWKYVGKFVGLKDSATIEHLLLHSSGLFVAGDTLDYTTRDGFIASIKNSPIESKPGEKYRYSNAGYTLLAAIVEIVINQPFEDVLYRMIFQPAGMHYTGYPWESRVDKKLFATGNNNKGEPQPPEPDIWGNRGPGNLVTNMQDIQRWYQQGWLGNKIISKEIRERMLTDHIPGKETFSWNKGITKVGKRFYHKGGGRPDFESQQIWWPDENVFLFFAINRDRDLRRHIFREINTYMHQH